MAEVDIQGVDKIALLRSLWTNQVTASFFGSGLLPAPAFSDEDATKALTRGYIDYFCGRAIKLDLTKDKVDPWAYDRDAGMGTLAKIVAGLRNGSPPTPKPDRFYCTTGAVFEPWGEEMLPGNPGTIMCALCGAWKKQHSVKK